MARDVVALVSVDDYVSAVRVYADRAHDLLRRSGVPPVDAIDLVETHALALLDAVVNAPETVIDLAGWWFAQAVSHTSSSVDQTTSGRSAVADEPGSASLLAGTQGEADVRLALAGLPPGERLAVLLRDAYDLPVQAAAVAMRRSAASTATLTAQGRLSLASAVEQRTPPDLSGHTGRLPVDLTSLSQLADGSLETPLAAPLRRHEANCQACDDTLETLGRGRRMAAGLPVAAMPDDARESVIDRVAARAAAVLPSHDEVLLAVDEDQEPGPLLSPVLVIVVLVLALAGAVAIAAATR